MNGNATAMILLVLTGIGSVAQAGIAIRAWDRREVEAGTARLFLRTAGVGCIVMVIPFLVAVLLGTIVPSSQMTSVGGSIVGYLCISGAVASWLLCQGGLAVALVIAHWHGQKRRA